MPTLIFNMETKALYEKCKRMMKDLDETTVSMGFASMAPQNAAILTGRGSVGDRKWGKKMLNNNKLIKGRKKSKNSFSNWGTNHDPYKEGENEVDKLLDKFDESYDITVELNDKEDAQDFFDETEEQFGIEQSTKYFSRIGHSKSGEDVFIKKNFNFPKWHFDDQGNKVDKNGNKVEERFNAPLGKRFNSDLNHERVLAARKRKRGLELGRQARLGQRGFNRRLSRKFNKKLGGK